MLQQKLDHYDQHFALILSDPILCMEFLRTTKDGTEDTSLWNEFTYRWYQRDILTDQNTHVSVTGGRSIGKCQIASDLIYTENGYQAISKIKNRMFRIWAWNPDTDTYHLRRAICVHNGVRKTYRITTEDNQVITVTGEHPLWTQDGWKLAKHITINDRLTHVVKLPQLYSIDYDEYEMRFIGYTLFRYWTQYTVYNKYDYKNQAVESDFNDCIDSLGIAKRGEWTKDKGKPKHPITALQYELGFHAIRVHGWKWHRRPLPEQMMKLNERNLNHLLSAMLSQYAQITTQQISIVIPTDRAARQLQELFLRFGITMDIRTTKDTEYFSSGKRHVELYTREYRDVYNILNTFTLRGYRIGNMSKPLEYDKNYRYVSITKIEDEKYKNDTWALQVEKDGTYITENMYVHNSYILEDKILWDVLNNRVNLQNNGELILTTANQAQMTPVLDKIILRFLASPLLRGYISGGLNKQKGVIDWNIGNKDVRMYARIVGSNTESNLIGLHVNRILIDEGQRFLLAAYRQLTPTLNTWFKNIQMFIAGVPNFVTNSALYYVDQRSAQFKKYRIPATNNPFYTEENFIDAIREYGGEDTDLFQSLVLGRWGKGSEQVITQEDIAKHSDGFYNYRYTTDDIVKKIDYKDKLKLIDVSEYSLLYCAIDTGFVDPTIIQVFGLKDGRWHVIVRYRLQRVDYPIQELIIDWLHSHYHFSNISIDLGSGGNAPAIIQSLMSRPEYKEKKYAQLIIGVMFQEHVTVGYNVDGSEVKEDVKSSAARELVTLLQNKQLLVSEIDVEGLSELERIARQKGINGQDKYFILSEGGKGKAQHDHIFSSFLCFAWSIRDMSYLKQRKKKLGRSIG